MVGEPARVIAQVRGPWRREVGEALAIGREEGACRLLEVRLIAEHRGHETVGVLLGASRAIAVGVGDACLIDERGGKR